MPSDVSVDLVSSSAIAEAPASRRLPVGLGLSVAACASVALWTCIGLGLRALLAA